MIGDSCACEDQIIEVTPKNRTLKTKTSHELSNILNTEVTHMHSNGVVSGKMAFAEFNSFGVSKNTTPSLI